MDHSFLSRSASQIFSFGSVRIDGIIDRIPFGGCLSDDHVVLAFFSSTVFVSPFLVGCAQVFIIIVIAVVVTVVVVIAIIAIRRVEATRKWTTFR